MPMFEDGQDSVSQASSSQQPPTADEIASAPPTSQTPSTLMSTLASTSLASHTFRTTSSLPGAPAPSDPIPIASTSSRQTLSHKLSEESIRTELCEGPLWDSPTTMPPMSLLPPSKNDEISTSDRAELIERIKRGESPTWIPRRRLEPLLCRDTSSSPPRSRPSSSETAKTSTPDKALLPAADITPVAETTAGRDASLALERFQDGMSIERPRSALHSGDFTHGPSQEQHNGRHADKESQDRSSSGIKGQSDEDGAGILPWMTSSPPHFPPFALTAHAPPPPPSLSLASLADMDIFRSGLTPLSTSLSSSFVYKPPTSPLVQSESNYDDDDDIDEMAKDDNADDGESEGGRVDAMDGLLIGSPSAPSGSTPWRRRAMHAATTPGRAPFRHSISSHYELLTPVVLPRPQARQRAASFRREGAVPYQAHQPRRSLSSFPYYPGASYSSMPRSPPAPSSLFSPSFRQRRLSHASDTASPLHHASMVGSYEESILRGRMSTTPSKPLDFQAQIGVLGLGPACKPALRCPPHVTLPFSAVFYSYASTSHGRSTSRMEDGPSPYVGMIDLENGLANSESEQRVKRKRMPTGTPAVASTPPAPGDDVAMQLGGEAGQHSSAGVSSCMTGSRKQPRRSHAYKSPPGGSYRIPPHGQLQIVIKNQNKTAVKLFLIPYDVSDMEPGTKTFIRQRIYSAGPVIDNDALASALPSSRDERPILRYLAHVHICCPSRGRYYLYKSIRIVFANRVPDGKEKLRNELTFPEPRYSPYKPIRAMHPPAQPVGATVHGARSSSSMLPADSPHGRRSSALLSSPSPLSTPWQPFLGGQPSSASAVGQAAWESPSSRQPLPIPTTSRANKTAMSLWLSSTPPRQPRQLRQLRQLQQQQDGAPDEEQERPRTQEQEPVPRQDPAQYGQFVSMDVSSGSLPVDAVPLGSLGGGGGNGSGHGSDGRSVSAGPSSTSSLFGHRIPQRAGEGRSAADAADMEAATEPLTYNKLSRGDVGYGGNAFTPMVDGSPVGEGLLSQRLRSLDVQKTNQQED